MSSSLLSPGAPAGATLLDDLIATLAGLEPGTTLILSRAEFESTFEHFEILRVVSAAAGGVAWGNRCSLALTDDDARYAVFSKEAYGFDRRDPPGPGSTLVAHRLR